MIVKVGNPGVGESTRTAICEVRAPPSSVQVAVAALPQWAWKEAGEHFGRSGLARGRAGFDPTSGPDAFVRCGSCNALDVCGHHDLDEEHGCEHGEQGSQHHFDGGATPLTGAHGVFRMCSDAEGCLDEADGAAEHVGELGAEGEDDESGGRPSRRSSTR